ncbi:uncharacterized protein MONOS_12829 [Monocercomonoides exilis]|uniref:uncharacterized protein n=1 Tax=Monocercomonoides exilis TaxID=2049356 RepID=UPI00355A156B|nr:hypothetical protein MONOS_12829 [Monocercomonoides exilis]|eukprot:MONOS_12829.1-p1 / transcript=MONOS_12829.1 / gene=MONOS_12829 / organism=Monocercomonoides_exilis_PA203 / gene_product=unspecified product / transcript_product=unspecified product / location=Mono_scaffold00740:4399-4698(+) / protein_length=100 / sequence_SO=supercontig / SO=protein_coding / is_pseudo=false
MKLFSLRFCGAADCTANTHQKVDDLIQCQVSENDIEGVLEEDNNEVEDVTAYGKGNDEEEIKESKENKGNEEEEEEEDGEKEELELVEYSPKAEEGWIV